MSVLNKKPYINSVLESLNSDSLNALVALMNGDGERDELLRTMDYPAGNRTNITVADKGVHLCSLQVGPTLYHGYLIYTDDYCTLIHFTDFNSLSIFNINGKSLETVSEYLDINELRRVAYEIGNGSGGGESGPTPIATIDGVDYFHVIKEVELVGTTDKTINIQTGEVSEGSEIPQLMSVPRDKRYWKLTSYDNHQSASHISVETYLTFGPNGATTEGIIPIVGAINTENGLYEEIFTNGYLKKDANDKFEFYFNLTHEGSGSEKITSSDIDSETATVGQVLTADGNGGAAWQNVASDGDFEEIDISQNGISTWGQLYEALGSTVVSHKLIKLTWRNDVRVQTKEYGVTISHPYGDVYSIVLAPAYADEMTRYYTYYSAYGALSTILEQTIYNSYTERQLLPSAKNTHSGQAYFAKLDTSGNAVWVEDAGSAGGNIIEVNIDNDTTMQDVVDAISGLTSGDKYSLWLNVSSDFTGYLHSGEAFLTTGTYASLWCRLQQYNYTGLEIRQYFAGGGTGGASLDTKIANLTSSAIIVSGGTQLYKHTLAMGQFDIIIIAADSTPLTSWSNMAGLLGSGNFISVYMGAGGPISKQLFFSWTIDYSNNTATFYYMASDGSITSSYSANLAFPNSGDTVTSL